MLLLFFICTPLILLYTIEKHEKDNEKITFFDNRFRSLLRDRKMGNVHAIMDNDKVVTNGIPKETEEQEQGKIMTIEDDIKQKEVKYYKKLPQHKTPCLDRAKKGHIKCEVDVDFLAYWNNPQGERDRNFISPFAEKKNPEQTHYISFEPDKGAWNNIRMSMECMFVIAVATGRTLVLPPPKPLYLLQNKDKKHRGFADFYSFEEDNYELFRHVPVISMEEFIKLEGVSDGGHLPISKERREGIMMPSKECDILKSSKKYCQIVFDYLTEVGHNLKLKHNKCFIFDKDVFEGREISKSNSLKVEAFCNMDQHSPREIVYFTKESQDQLLWHFQTFQKEYRLLIHYYNLIYFTDPMMNNYVKRFVRDFLRYKDEIFCAAGKIIRSIPTTSSELEDSNKNKGLVMNRNKEIRNDIPGFSTMHARRGDFQYKRSKVSGEDWYTTTSDIWLQNEVLYIATDEKNKTFFNVPFKKHHEHVYYLDDFWAVAGLENVDSAYFGMIDTIVASFGRVFAGTYFSTFSGFINRMRGYHGISMKSSWYVPSQRKTTVHEWTHAVTYARESPDGWVRIDGDEIVDESDF